MCQRIYCLIALLVPFSLVAQDFSSGNIEEKTSEKHDRFTFHTGAGFSYRIAPLADDIPAEFLNYARKLKQGVQWNMAAAYYFSKYLGVGILYNKFHSANEVILEVEQPGGITIEGRMADAVKIQYAGPTLDVRFGEPESRWKFISSYGIGYLHYRNDASYFGKFTLTGNSVGLNVLFSVEFKITESLALNAHAGSVLGAYTRFNINDGFTDYNIYAPPGQGENVSRVDFGLGIGFN